MVQVLVGHADVAGADTSERRRVTVHHPSRAVCRQQRCLRVCVQGLDESAEQTSEGGASRGTAGLIGERGGGMECCFLHVPSYNAAADKP